MLNQRILLRTKKYVLSSVKSNQPTLRNFRFLWVAILYRCSPVETAKARTSFFCAKGSKRDQTNNLKQPYPRKIKNFLVKPVIQ